MAIGEVCGQQFCQTECYFATPSPQEEERLSQGSVTFKWCKPAIDQLQKREESDAWMDGWMGGCITRPPAAKSSKSGTLSLSPNISQSWKTISNYRCWFSVNIKETPGDCSEEELLWFVALSNLLFASSHCLVVAILPRVLLHSDTIPACGLFQIASLSCIAFCHHHPCLAAHQWSDASLLEYNRLP